MLPQDERTLKVALWIIERTFAELAPAAWQYSPRSAALRRA
jgi:hypothetical protein